MSDFYRILCDTLAPGEPPLQIAAYPQDDADGIDPAYRFEVTYQWWHGPNDGPYEDSLTIVVHRSRCCRHAAGTR